MVNPSSAAGFTEHKEDPEEGCPVLKKLSQQIQESSRRERKKCPEFPLGFVFMGPWSVDLDAS